MQQAETANSIPKGGCGPENIRKVPGRFRPKVWLAAWLANGSGFELFPDNSLCLEFGPCRPPEVKCRETSLIVEFRGHAAEVKSYMRRVGRTLVRAQPGEAMT